MRLQNLVNEKEQRKQNELRMKQEQRYFSMSLTKNQNLNNLQTSLKKAFRSKSKKEQRLAQMQIQKQLHQLTKIDKFDPRPKGKSTEENKQSKGDVNINVVHTSIVNLNDQTSFQGVKVSHQGASFGQSAHSSRQPVYNKQSSPIQKAQQYYNLSPTYRNIEQPLQQFNQKPSKNLDLVVNPQTHVIMTPTIELEKDSKTLASKSQKKSQLGSKSPTASNDTSPNNQLHFHPLKKLVFADEDQKSEGTIEMDQKNDKDQSKMMIQERIDTQEFMDEIQKNNQKLMEVQKKINQAQQDYVKSTLKTFTSNAFENPPQIEIQDAGITFENTKMSKHPRERNIVISKQGTPFEAGDLNAWPQDEENTPLPYQMVAQKPIIHVPSANIKTPLGQKTQKHKTKGGFQFNEISMSPDNFHQTNIFQDHRLISSPVNQSAVFNYPSPNPKLQQNSGKRRVRPFTGTKRRQNIHENAIKAADSSSKTSFNVVGQPVNNSSTNYGSLDFAHAHQPGQNLRMTKFLGTVEGHPNLQYGLANQPYSPHIQGNSSRVITQSPFLNDPSVPDSAQFGQRGIAQNIHTFSHDIIHEHPQRNGSGDFFNNQFSEIKIQSTANLNPLNNMNNTEQSQNMNSEEMTKQSLALIQYSQQQIQNQQNYLNSCRETQVQLSPQVLEQKTQRFNEPLSSSTNASQAANKSKLSKNVKHRIQSASIRQSRLPNASIHFRDKQRVFLPRGGGNSSRIAGGNFQTYRKTENESRWVGDTQQQFPTSRPIKSPDSQAESKVDKYTIRQNSSHGSRTKRGALGGGFYTRNLKKKEKSNKTQEGTLKSLEPNNDDINLHMQPTFSNDMSGGELSHYVDKNGYRLSETPAKSALVSPQTAMSPALPIEVKMPNLENYIQEQI